jgi:predicted Rossmann-fold nucleotide-binding protein
MLRIISGGQTGVDRAALDAAIQLGIGCGGFCPKGRKSEDGIIPEKYPLIETHTYNYPERTELNVKTGDGTLILFAGTPDRGTQLTIELCRRHNKPCVVINLPDEKERVDVKSWLQKNNIHILNVAGNRESISPGIHEKAYLFLIEVLKNFAGSNSS